MEETEVKKALKVIVDNRDKTKALNWAVNYAFLGLSMSGHELKVQCLYVLNNITHWRGPEAKSVKETLKRFTKSENPHR